jgi:hypothetical protein
VKEVITINVASDFSDAPAARYRNNGPKSGQEFYEDLLLPKFLIAVCDKTKLQVNLDDTWGYASSFLSESFERLSTEQGAETVIEHLEIVSNDEPELIEIIYEMINNPDYSR